MRTWNSCSAERLVEGGGAGRGGRDGQPSTSARSISCTPGASSSAPAAARRWRRAHDGGVPQLRLPADLDLAGVLPGGPSPRARLASMLRGAKASLWPFCTPVLGARSERYGRLPRYLCSTVRPCPRDRSPSRREPLRATLEVDARRRRRSARQWTRRYAFWPVLGRGWGEDGGRGRCLYRSVLPP